MPVRLSLGKGKVWCMHMLKALKAGEQMDFREEALAVCLCGYLLVYILIAMLV